MRVNVVMEKVEEMKKTIEGMEDHEIALAMIMFNGHVNELISPGLEKRKKKIEEMDS